MTGDYNLAIHAIVYLYNKKDGANSEMLAKNICTNSARVRKVMLKLKKSEIIITKEGQGGGYRLNPKFYDVSLFDIAVALEQEIVEPKWYPGNPCSDCAISNSIEPILKDIYFKLNIDTMNILKNVYIKDISDKIISKISDCE